MFDKAILGLPGAKRVLALAAACAVLRALCAVGQAFFLASAVVALWNGAAVSSQAVNLAAFFLCFVGMQAVAWASDAIVARFAAATAAEVRRSLLDAVFTCGSGIVSAEGSGSVGALAIEGVDAVEEYLRLVVPKMCALIVVPVVLFACALVVDWVSGLIMALAFPAIILLMVLIGSTAQKAANARHREFSQLAGHFIDSLRGMTTLRAFGRARGQADEIYRVSERFREATMKTLRIATLSSAVIDFAATMSVAAVAIMLGFRMTAGAIAFFPALFVLILVPEYFKPIRDFAADYHATLDGKTSLAAIQAAVSEATRGSAKKRSFEDGAAEGEGTEGAGAMQAAASSSGNNAQAVSSPSQAGSTQTADVASSPAVSWGADSQLDLVDVGFSYPDHRALEGVSLSVHGTEKIGIVGASGSGKSTLISLLAGFAVPNAGTVRLDGSPARLDAAAWRSGILYIPQTPFIFSATLADNITLYTPDAPRADIERAVRAVGLERLVSELPAGLDARVGDGGRELSGGERQRVALARAFLDRSRRVLLFDEPTAHLDIETELELKERMLPLMEGRLVIFATHRLHWVDSFDAVAVLEDGRMTQFGDPQELVKADGAFSRLLTGFGGEA